MFVQSHTPFADLVHNETSFSEDGDEGQGDDNDRRLKDQNVLVVGGDGDSCRRVAQSYGFSSVITPSDLLISSPSLLPFTNPHIHKPHSRPLPLPIYDPSLDPSPDPQKHLRIHAVFVFADPRDWGLDTQVLLDVLTSHNGIIGTCAPIFSFTKGNNRQVPLYFSNPDLLWSSSYHLPRLGQGGFQAAFLGVWNAITNHHPLQYTTIGKPSHTTFEFAERRLREHRQSLLWGDGAGNGGEGRRELRKVYMVGDNPASDIVGGNTYASPFDSSWETILVRSGVYNENEGEPEHKPDVIVDGVWDAVTSALEKEGWAGGGRKLEGQEQKGVWQGLKWGPTKAEMGE
ncbi:MAG: hypothetical protein Q9201_004936 [Fulgogasparrea decipioides]